MSEQQQTAEQKQVVFDTESAKLATIQEEKEHPEKKSVSSIIKAVIAKAKSLLGCINFEKREKPAKTEEKKEELEEEKSIEEPKVESVAPILPPVSAPAPAATVAPVAPVVAVAAPPADI